MSSTADYYRMKQLERELQESRRLQRVSTYAADARRWANAIIEDLQPLHEQFDVQEPETDDDPYHIPCSKCGQPTTFDSTYGDLCYRCCRADNE